MVWEVDVLLVRRLQPDVGHHSEQYFRGGLGHHVGFTIPTCTFQVESVDVRTIFRSNVVVVIALFTENFKVKIDLVDSDHISTSEILLDAGQERLGKEKS